MRFVVDRLSYANIAATLAIVLALGGTAYAAGLAKNSVKSSTIKNGQVRSPDLKNDGIKAADIAPGAVTSAEIADGSVTGTDVNEATLGQVPDASALDGLPASAFPRTGPSIAGSFLESGSLQLNVPGYGAYAATCNDNNTPATANDDLVSYSYSPSLGANAMTGLRVTTAGGPTTAAVINVLNKDAGNGAELVAEDDRMQVDQFLRSADGLKAIRISMWGFDDSTTTGCYAVLEAQILR